MSLNTVKILGVSVTSTSTSLVLSKIMDFVAKPNLKAGLLVFTPNPEFLVEADCDYEFRDLLNKSDINLPDGIGLVWASRLLGEPIKERISGAEVVRELLGAENEGGKWEVGSGRLDSEVGSGRWAVGVVGARRGVRDEADELIKRLEIKYPNLTFVNLDDSKLKIKNFKLKIVFACHGMKKQEEWIWENKDKIKANVFMGIGGSLDFITGFSRRAPKWIRKVGLEWLWRGLQKPSHFKRVWKAVVVFGWLAIREKIKEKFVSARSLLAG